MSDRAEFSSRGPILAGVVAVLIFFGGFGVWATTAKISGAAVSIASLVATGQNKTIQHLEGGIVKEIVVAEGERIELGAPLVILDETQARATLDRLTGQRDVFRALAARLDAERRGQEEIRFPDALLARSKDPVISRLLEDQRQEFDARKQRVGREMGILNQRILALREEITGLDAQIAAGGTQIELIAEERRGLQSLFDKGLSRKDRLLALKRTEADLTGKNGEYAARIAKARQTIAETELQIARAGNVRVEEANKELTQVRSDLAGIETQIAAAEDVLDRVVIRAPVSGSVIRLDVHTSGAVITPGQPIMEILPEGAELLIEAQVRPEDIDLVSVGQKARIRLSALDRRTTPMVDAVVTYVSADLIVNPKDRVSYYLARLRFDDLKETGVDVADLHPGMSVEAFLQTEDRTFVEYVTKPLMDSLQKSFREE